MEYAKTINDMLMASKSSNLPDDALVPVLRFKNELDKEGLNVDMTYAGVLMVLHSIASQRRNFEEADEYLRDWKRFMDLPDIRKPEQVYLSPVD